MTFRFKDHVRPYYLEEPFDFCVFRPAALLLLKVLYPTPITPNQVSWFALLVAAVSGHYLSLGTRAGFLLGGIGILVFSVLDCADGMLARMKKNNGIMGEALDMFVDIMASISFFVGLSVGLTKTFAWSHYWFLPILSGIVIMVHASIYQFYKKRFCFHRDGAGTVLEDHLAKFRAYRDQIREEGGHYFDRVLLFIHLTFHKPQENAADVGGPYFSPEYVEKNRATLPLWAITAGSSHLGILGFALVFDQLKFFFAFSLFLSQLILIISSVAQAATAKQLGRIAS